MGICISACVNDLALCLDWQGDKDAITEFSFILKRRNAFQKYVHWIPCCNLDLYREKAELEPHNGFRPCTLASEEHICGYVVQCQKRLLWIKKKIKLKMKIKKKKLESYRKPQQANIDAISQDILHENPANTRASLIIYEVITPKEKCLMQKVLIA